MYGPTCLDIKAPGIDLTVSDLATSEAITDAMQFWNGNADRFDRCEPCMVIVPTHLIQP